MKRNQVEDEPLQKRGFFVLQPAHSLYTELTGVISLYLACWLVLHCKKRSNLLKII